MATQPRWAYLLLVLGSTLACTGRDDDGDDDDDGAATGIGPLSDVGSMDGSSSSGALPEAETEPGWSECFSPFSDEYFDTCQAACLAEGRVCLAGGCDGITVEGFTFSGCTLGQGGEAIGCLDDIDVLGNSFKCCCI